MQESGAALELYKRLIEQAPSMRTFWETRIAALQQQLAANPAAADQPGRIN
jgi:hypothetical protein